MKLTEEIKLIFLALLSVALFGGIGLVERQVSLRAPEIYIERPFVPANIVVNTNKSFGPMPSIWRALAQGGEEQNPEMLKPTVSYINQLGIKYIRIDHIFDDDYYGVVKGRNSDGSLLLDWTKLDIIVEDILSSGAKPFFSLSYMPGLIAASKIDAPANWYDWQDLVRQTVEHYSSKIKGVYYEVWNEPSLDHFGGWRMWGDKDYKLLYLYSVQGVGQATDVLEFKIGGPAIPEMDSVWIKTLFNYVLENNLRLDFISWHRYSFDINRFLEDVYEINVLTNQPYYQRFTNIEKVITEWGPNPEKDTVYSSQIAASHLIAVSRKLLDKVSLAFAFEVKDGPNQGTSGWGLLSHETVGLQTKPRFNIYQWLADFKGQRLEIIGEGSNTIGLAVKEGRQQRVLLTNYNPYTPRDESFQLTFSGLRPGQYRLVKKLLFKSTDEQIVDVKTSSLVLNLNLAAYDVLKLELVNIGR